MQIVFNPWFDKFILLTIFANCVCLAIESPGEEPDPVIETLDIVFLVIFSIEMVLKIIAMGFVMEAHSYLRDPWNIVSVVISQITDMDVYTGFKWFNFHPFYLL